MAAHKLARRIAIRPKHSPSYGPVENRPFVGSVMIVNNTDAESIRSKLKSDIYTQEGIWDLENSENLPFHMLERTPAKLEK
ncbi:uncharacterized protein N7529_002797 [Penicillium soppii]|uniref:uncharacterized protein n=1 Tax=Penicillium soppii TaxID=69789 RepID=UPI0025488D9A|nr:uncharacterized protein N7529_002797 [Penicillium soppii]KAJ5874367.1 hypothetical protein N7529_002797 [Penicillium soppii]